MFLIPPIHHLITKIEPITSSCTSIIINSTRLFLFLFVLSILFYRLFMIYIKPQIQTFIKFYAQCLLNRIEDNGSKMNFGIWENDTSTIYDANTNLINRILMDIEPVIANFSANNSKKTLRILEVNCGSGLLSNMLCKEIEKCHSNCIIDAIDPCSSNIHHANNHYFRKNIYYKHIPINKLDEKYDIIIYLEKGIYEHNRQALFREIHRLLNVNGTFITSDIVFQNTTDSKKTSLFQSIIKILTNCWLSNLFGIPKHNLISFDTWNKQLCELFTKRESEDITEKSLIPYMKYLHKHIQDINVIKCVPFFKIPCLFYKFFADKYKYKMSSQHTQYVYGVYTIKEKND